jgi:predicted ribosome quality control (RQC) complex YloA/Tae2 family protein
MENFILNAITAEIAALIDRADGLRTGKIFAAGTFALGFDLRLRDGRVLLISANPSNQRFYLSMRHPRDAEANASGDPAFLQRLRKTLSGSRLIGIEKPASERSITLIFDGYAESGAPQLTRLRVDLTGRTSNIYWLDENDRILDALRPSEAAVIGVRHELPARDLLDWDQASPELFAVPPHSLESRLRSRLRGCGATLAREIAFRAAEKTGWNAFCDVRDALRQPCSGGFVYEQTPQKNPPSLASAESRVILTAIPLAHCAEWRQTRFESVNEAADAYFQRADHAAALFSKRQRWASAVSAWLKRIESALEKISASDVSDEDSERWRRWGELLYANAKTGRLTPQGFEATDYYASNQEKILIPLEEGEDAPSGARRYFQKYQKSQRARLAVAERRATLAKHLHLATRLRNLLAEAASDSSLEAAVAEAAQTLPDELRPKDADSHRKRKPKSDDLAGLRRYRGPDDYEILVGRTDRDNDRLTFRLARPHDMWLHAADYPGAHVLIRSVNRQPIPWHVVMAAAELAAFFSKAKHSDKVSVHCAERRRLARPRNGAPGSVLLTESKTILATPREKLERIL